jgi:hypothetical protein
VAYINFETGDTENTEIIITQFKLFWYIVPGLLEAITNKLDNGRFLDFSGKKRDSVKIICEGFFVRFWQSIEWLNGQ